MTQPVQIDFACDQAHWEMKRVVALFPLLSSVAWKDSSELTAKSWKVQICTPCSAATLHKYMISQFDSGEDGELGLTAGFEIVYSSSGGIFLQTFLHIKAEINQY